MIKINVSTMDEIKMLEQGRLPCRFELTQRKIIEMYVSQSKAPPPASLPIARLPTPDERDDETHTHTHGAGMRRRQHWRQKRQAFSSQL